MDSVLPSHHYTYQFLEPDQWHEAAERFLALDEKIAELDKQDAEINHDDLHENFVACDTCDQLHALIERRKGFAEKFAPVWARKALEFGEAQSFVRMLASAGSPGVPDLDSMIETARTLRNKWEGKYGNERNSNPAA